MATTATPVTGNLGTGWIRAWDIKATADADTTLVIAHGMTFPDPVNDMDQKFRIVFIPTDGAFYDQKWIVGAFDATNLTLTKTSVAGGTGSPGESARVYLEFLACEYT